MKAQLGRNDSCDQSAIMKHLDNNYTIIVIPALPSEFLSRFEIQVQEGHVCV